MLHMSQPQPAHSPLLALPDPCLLAVMGCCAAIDQRSLFSAARAHSRLHQAATLVLRSIKADVRHDRQLVDIMLYLAQQGCHIRRLRLFGRDHLQLALHQLPPSLQLHALKLEGFHLQLQPGNGWQGVLGAKVAAAAAGAPPLTQLWLNECTLLDGMDGLAAALLQLPALQHLSLRSLVDGTRDDVACITTGVLQQLPHLSYLDIEGADVQGPDTDSPALQPLQALTKLAHLRLLDLCPADLVVTASMLSGMHDLTHLVINNAAFQPGALAGKPKLQHLVLDSCTVRGAAGVAAVLAQLQPLQQLAHLDLGNSLGADTPDLQHQGFFAGTGADSGDVRGGWPPAAAYSALTANSKLQHLNISQAMLPAGVWQHLFPADRQLPHLRYLNIAYVEEPSGMECPAPEGKLLARCCPGLQHLVVLGLQCTEEQLRELRAVAADIFWAPG